MQDQPAATSPGGDRSPAPVSTRRPRSIPHIQIPPLLFSMRFAIWIALTLAFASVAGILVQEFFPARDAQQAESLSQRLPGPVYALFMLLQLHDPFRALWFKSLLGLLALSLGLCALKNFRPNFHQAFRLHPLHEPRALLALPDAATLHHTTPDLFDTVVQRLRRRWFVGTVETGVHDKVAALHQGGWARTGPVIMHIGILVLVVGGLATSIVGKRFFLSGSPGETLALGESSYAVRVEDFRIETDAQGQVKQYHSQLTVLDAGREVRQQGISVNHPLRFGGYNIYQASYQADPSRAKSLTLAIRLQSASDVEPHAEGHAHPTAAEETPLLTTMDSITPVPGHDGYELRVRRFFAHLQITPDGPINASRELANPAAEIEIRRLGQVVGVQWAFLRFPAHARPGLPFVVELRGAQPALSTGLEVNTNPGAPLVWLGFLLATLGLVLGFFVRHRVFYLVARPAERGWTLWIAGRCDRERVAFSSEFERFVRHVHAEARRLKQEAKAAPATALPPKIVPSRDWVESTPARR